VDIAPFYNKGIIFGQLSELPPVLNIVSASTLFGPIFVIYLLAQYLILHQSKKLNFSMAMFFGGVLGNVYDRIIYGNILDFLRPNDILFFPRDVVFNFADIFQCVGFIMISASLIIDRDRIWHPENVRSKYFVNPEYQLKFASIFALVSLFSTIIIGIFSYTYLRFVLKGQGHHISQDILSSYMFSYISLSVVFAVISFTIGIILSHKAAGPLVAFERFLEELKDGKVSKFGLRKQDDFKQLEDATKTIMELVKNASDKQK
jgi:signal peptidase II